MLNGNFFAVKGRLFLTRIIKMNEAIDYFSWLNGLMDGKTVL